MILNILSLIPTLYPIVKKVIEVEKTPIGVTPVLPGITANEWKHNQVFKWIKATILPTIKRKLDVSDDDINTIIKFCVIVYKKAKDLNGRTTMEYRFKNWIRECLFRKRK